MAASTRGKSFAMAAFAIVLIAALSLFAYAASGPSTVRTVQTQPEKQQQKAGEVTAEEAAKYKCSSVDTMRERVKCRLQLTEENEYGYLPEECRALVNASRENCVSNYHKSQDCWKSLKDDERFECAKKSFGLTESIAAQKAQCDGLAGTEKASCMTQLTGRVDAVVKFRIYNLEEKAQRLMEKGQVDLDTVTGFVTALEQQKQNYNDAKTVADKRAIVKGVQKLWQEFVAKPKQKEKEMMGNKETGKGKAQNGNRT